MKLEPIKVGDVREIVVEGHRLAVGTKILIGEVRDKCFVARIYAFGGQKCWTNLDWLYACTRKVEE